MRAFKLAVYMLCGVLTATAVIGAVFFFVGGQWGLGLITVIVAMILFTVWRSVENPYPAKRN